MQKSKKSNSCGCFAAIFKRKKAQDHSETPKNRNIINNSSQMIPQPVQISYKNEMSQSVVAKAKSNKDFYSISKNTQVENDSLPGIQTNYKSTIVNPLSKSYGNPIFPRESLPVRQIADNYRENLGDSLESTQKFNFDSRKQTTPPFHNVSGIRYMQLPALSHRAMGDDYVPNLFDTRVLKRNPGSLPHLMPVTPARFRRHNMPSSRDNQRLENILSELKKELEEEPRVGLD